MERDSSHYFRNKQAFFAFGESRETENYDIIPGKVVDMFDFVKKINRLFNRLVTYNFFIRFFWENLKTLKKTNLFSLRQKRRNF